MNKKIFLVIVLFVSLILVGCSKSGCFSFNFDGFYINFDTDKKFEENKNKLSGLGYEIIDTNIVKIFSEKGSTGFTDSIIVTKKGSDLSLSAFSSQNVENIDIEGYKVGKSKTQNITCKDENLGLITYNSRYYTNQYIVYLSQGFIKKGTNIYIVSFATLDEKERNNFTSSLKGIRCK